MTKDTIIAMETSTNRPDTEQNSKNSETNSSSNSNIPLGGLNDKKVPPYPTIPPPPYVLDIPPKNNPPPTDSNSETPLRKIEYDTTINQSIAKLNNDNERGLTPSETETIMNLLAELQRTALESSLAGRRAFSDVEEKLIKLLRDAQPRLKSSEKERILKEIRNINQMRKNKDLDERKICDYEEYTDTEYAVDFWAIVLKIPQLVMVLIAFQKNITFPCSHFENIFNAICLITAFCSVCLLIYYCSCRKPSMLILVLEYLYCCICFLIYLFFSIYFICGDVRFFGCGATIAYGYEMLTKLHAIYRRKKSLDKKHYKDLRFKKYRKWQYWFPKEETSNIGDRQRSESASSLNFLDDKFDNKISSDQPSRRKSGQTEYSDHSSNED